MPKVLFVAAEAVPFIKTGGLADVIGSLPKELVKEGVDARVILPKYSEIPSHYREIMEPVHILEVPVGWRRQYCGIEKLEYQGITFYFIDNEYYFKRKGLYGHYDDGERFAYFCRAVLESLPYLDFTPDILHCHDWHTAVIPVLLAAHYREAYPELRTGVFAKEVLGDLLSLGEEYFTAGRLEFFGAVNYMKGGLVFADRLTTVSPTYAEEIKTPYFGEKLDSLLQSRGNDLYGIINGLDYDLYNPRIDDCIAVPYTWRSSGRKLKNKMKLQEHVGLPVRADVPVVAIVSRLVAAKGLDLVAHVIEEIIAEDIQLIVLGTGEERYEGMFRLAAHRYPDKVSANIFFGEELAHKIYAGADIFLMPSCFEPCGIGQLIALRYGTLPVVRETGGLKDTVQPYNEYTGEGNGFSFANYNAHDMLDTLRRALAVYRQGDVWERIIRNAMRSDYSWSQSAQQYRELYHQLV
ncbi:hypothetical protein Lal_00049274 [Lupinus albus]|nr:hypothetical protein Lal_00049274 [Lupinus albus]